MKLHYLLLLLPSLCLGQQSISLTQSEIDLEIRSVVVRDSIIRMKKRIADGWDIRKLNTADTCHYMHMREKEMILEVNMVRSNPAKYIPYLKGYIGDRSFYDSLTKELRRMSSVGILLPDKDLYENSSTRAESLAEFGALTHFGGLFAENLYLSHSLNDIEPRRALIALLVDDMSINHQKHPFGHRRAILAPDQCCMAASLAAGKDNWIWVQQFR